MVSGVGWVCRRYMMGTTEPATGAVAGDEIGSAEKRALGCLRDKGAIGKGGLSRRCHRGSRNEGDCAQLISQGETHETLPELESSTNLAW